MVSGVRRLSDVRRLSGVRSQEVEWCQVRSQEVE